jgi:ADP-heptose:LPS heptosyltransferase
MKRNIKYGIFKWVVYSECKGMIHRHPYQKELVYVLGEEEEKWKKLIAEWKPRRGCRETILNKEVVELADLGFSLADKNGNV